MANFVFGAIAGALIACIATIAAARNPEVQGRLGLIPPVVAAVPAPPPKPEPACPSHSVVGPPVAAQDLLFSKKRFWSVAP